MGTTAMTATCTKIDRSALLRRAWHLAREAATAANAAVRSHIGAGFRQAWAEAKASAVSFEPPVIAGEIRDGGSGASAWVARVVGTHEKFGLDRKFIDKASNVSRSGRSGYFKWTLDRPGVYELRGIQYKAGEATIGQLDNGFISVDAGGAMTRITKAEALAIAETMHR